ncbi:MAG: choice-of-anchor tandem repeat GloVer-containing protein, partial [Capsulimonadaceae bacterium]
SYNVYRGTASGSEGSTAIGTATSTAYTDSSVTNGTEYYYKVAAVNGGGTSAQSSEASATPEPPIPAAPTGLTATGGNTQVSLSWTASSGATTYNIYRGTASGAEGSTAAATGITTPSYTDTGLANGVTYFYKVAAVNGGGTSPQSSEASGTPELSIPPAPTGLTAAAGNAQIALSWTASTGATSYSIYRGTASGAEASTAVGTATTPAYTDTGLTNGLTYFYTVAAVNGVGTSARSTEAFATPQSSPGAPTGLSATSSSGALILSWSGSSSATSYNIYQGTAAGGEGSTPVQSTTATSIMITGLTNLKYYYFQVAGVNGTGSGPVSNEASNRPILETILHTFGNGTVPNDGLLPNGVIEASNGIFYGTTAEGGSANLGTVFEIDASGSETILHSFGDGTVPDDGTTPDAGLVLASDGNLYGTTQLGGSTAISGQPGSGLGTVFRITPAGVVTILHSFGDGSVSRDGYNPEAALVQGLDGNFYGVTDAGGSNGCGTVFRITPAGVETTLHNFDDGTVENDGYYTTAPLIQGLDGNFYGTTNSGGVNYNGTLFRITPSGVESILHWFGDGTVANDGTCPEGVLVQTSDGMFYGNTALGGSANCGSVFRMTPAGVLTILHSFNDGTVPYDGIGPYAGLIQASDGNLYGTTENGGYVGSGTAYRTDLSGNVSILHGFGDGSVAGEGVFPFSGVIQGIDNALYGTTYDGATFYRIDADAVPPLPSAPTGLTAIPGDGQVSLVWTEGTYSTSYNVYRGTTSGGEGSTPIGAATTPAFTDTGVTNGIKYFYKVSAVNATGTSPQSIEASAKPEPPAPAAPTGLAATAGNSQVALSWTASTGATTYNVYRGTATGAEASTALVTGITGSGYTNMSVTNGTTYFYKVAAVNGGGTSAESNEASATPEPPTPTVPTGVTATAGNTQVSLSWTASSGATSYNVYRGTASGDEASTAAATGITTASYTDTGLTNGVKYFYKVAAVNSGGTSAQSSEASATPEPPIPAAPTALTATGGNAQVSLSWTASTGATSYNVYRSTASGAETSTAVGTSTSTMYTDTGLTNGARYFYKVTAVNAGGTSAPSGEASTTLVPNAPAGVSATAGNAQVELSWTSTYAATSYAIYRGTASGGEGATPVASANGLSYDDTGLTNGVTYFYKVAALNAGGTSALSTEVSATPEPPVPAAPASLTATAGNGQVALSWTASTGATSYNVYRGTTSGGEASTAIGASTTSSYTDSAVTNGVEYYYKVAAVNGGGMSALSNEASATPTPPLSPTHVLWSNSNGSLSLWNYNPATGSYTQN